MGKKTNGMQQQNIPLSAIIIAIISVVIIIAANILIIRSASYNMTRQYLLSQLTAIVGEIKTDVTKLKDKTFQVVSSAPATTDMPMTIR